ncbi:MAG: hypothetical protein R3E12_03045 [Candidatus Eisenbacteria bacterium]|uniref:Uncharacterized protein n=1 Tax=Eiseniibacteriota bacterium TaxID=2212470 RepID=A0A956M1N0_UNCEI|nr:hypothetical protein [Candidatus Eisenbacteria bacterium]
MTHHKRLVTLALSVLGLVAIGAAIAVSLRPAWAGRSATPGSATSSYFSLDQLAPEIGRVEEPGATGTTLESENLTEEQKLSLARAAISVSEAAGTRFLAPMENRRERTPQTEEEKLDALRRAEPQSRGSFPGVPSQTDGGAR